MKPVRALLKQLFAAPPRRWMSGRLWALVAVLLLAAQVGLLVHQASHHIRADIVATDECALCQVSAGMTDAPAPPMLVLPVFILLMVVGLPAIPAPRAARVVRAFRSRAPPASLSI